jgi:hypothetical protein
MSARSISPELVVAFKRLRLGGLLPTLAERLTLAEKHSTPLEDVLLMLLTSPTRYRAGTARRRYDGRNRPASTRTWFSSAGIRPRRCRLTGASSTNWPRFASSKITAM